MAQLRRLPRVFVDTSALIAAFLSPTGAAGAVLDLHRVGAIRAVLSDYILSELERSKLLRPSLPQQRLAFFLLSRPEIVALPSQRSIARAALVISTKDAPVIAGAQSARVDALVTWDKEFLAEAVERYLGCPVYLPGDFLKRFRMS